MDESLKRVEPADFPCPFCRHRAYHVMIDKREKGLHRPYFVKCEKCHARSSMASSMLSAEQIWRRAGQLADYAYKQLNKGDHNG